MNILLNWFPPAFKKIPSPSMSILKGYLNQYGHNSFVCYWNYILRDIIQHSTGLSDKYEANEFDILVPFLPILLSNIDNKDKFDKLCIYYQSRFPQYFNINKQDYFKNTLLNYSNQIFKRFNDVMVQLYSDKNPSLIGVNISLLQLVPANVFSNISKNNYPNIPIIAGGISNKNEAISVLDNFDYYDFAIWGEGENPLHQLCRALDHEISIEDVPNLAYKKDGKVITNQRNKLFSNLDTVKPNYEDYFDLIQNNNINLEQILIPIESSRGCHWNQCMFCFLTEGYRNRSKENNAIIDEILLSIDKYNVFEFVFLDNDIIFNDNEKFNNLLNQFIEIKEKHEKFGIWNGEVVTKGLNSNIIKKMSLAGFKSIQIGYEAISDCLLRKINKKNSFSSNLLFVKWSSEYNLKLQGLNIITGLVGEDDSDIKTSITNLHYLRFYINENTKHEIIPLQIMKTSRYYNILKNRNELDEWNYNPLHSLLPNSYIKDEQKFDILFFAKNDRNTLWDNFERINNHYLAGDYKYKIFISKNGIIQYVETLNGSIVNKLDFYKENNYHWNILCFCNNEVKSFDQIIGKFDLQENTTEQENVRKAILELNNEFLLYSNPEFTENVTIINTDFVL